MRSGGLIRSEAGPDVPSDDLYRVPNFPFALHARLVYINACESWSRLNEEPPADGLKQAFLAKGAENYMGNVGDVTGASADVFAFHLFDHMMVDNLSIAAARLGAIGDMLEDQVPLGGVERSQAEQWGQVLKPARWK